MLPLVNDISVWVFKARNSLPRAQAAILRNTSGTVEGWQVSSEFVYTPAGKDPSRKGLQAYKHSNKWERILSSTCGRIYGGGHIVDTENVFLWQVSLRRRFPSSPASDSSTLCILFTAGIWEDRIWDDILHWLWDWNASQAVTTSWLWCQLQAKHVILA